MIYSLLVLAPLLPFLLRKSVPSVRDPIVSMVPVMLVGALSLSCQTLVGLEDKQLDPIYGPSSDAAGGSDASGDAPDGSGDSAVDAGADADSAVEASPKYPQRPPGRPDGGIPEGGADASIPDAGGKTITMAVRRFYVGSIDPDSDIRTYDAWRQFGYDIDGHCTTLSDSELDQSGVCKRPPGAKSSVLEDGFDCRDNTFGHLIADVLLFADTDFERVMHTRTNGGVSQTLIFQLVNVGSGPDEPYVPARIYVSAPTQFPPLWNGTDLFQVDEKYVLGSVEQPKFVIEHGYIRDHMWVSGDFNESPGTVPMMLFDKIVEVNMDTFTMSIQLDPTNSKPLHGMLSAVLKIDEIAPLLRRGVLEATGCNEEIANLALNGYFLPGNDLASDSPDFVNPDVYCDRQSLGIFFELIPVQPPEEAVVVEPIPSVCDNG